MQKEVKKGLNEVGQKALKKRVFFFDNLDKKAKYSIRIPTKNGSMDLILQLYFNLGEHIFSLFMMGIET